MIDTGIHIHRKKLAKLALDPKQSAKAVNLVYVSDNMKGIARKGDPKSFTYYMGGKPVKNKETLQRIRSLVLPPAWTKVWICPIEDGHLQATGYDARGRKQYKYHPLWIAVRNQTKFSHMYEFGKVLPGMRQKIATALNKEGLPLEKVLAAVVSVMQYTNVRIGNSSYEKEYGSYGLTTLKDKHVQRTANGMKFSFKGKKGVYQQVELNNKKLVHIVQQCKDIPGKELFQYYDDDGKHYAIDSGMVNDYIREISGDSFTAKDFRTWFGSLKALQQLKEAGCCDTEKERKAKIVDAIDAVATQLGNTRAVCRKYYVHPAVLSCYNENMLGKYFDDVKPAAIKTRDLSTDEKSMMKILETQTCINVAEL